jgi:hypothetical protein
MRRVWAAVVTVWATLAVFAVLAWSHQGAPASSQATPVTIVVPGKNGKPHRVQVFIQPAGAAAHAATHSSQSTGNSGSGSVFIGAASATPHVVTGRP